MMFTILKKPCSFFFTLNAEPLPNEHYIVVGYMSTFRLTSPDHIYGGFDEIREWLCANCDQNYAIDGVYCFRTNHPVYAEPMPNSNGKKTLTRVRVRVPESIAPQFKLWWM